MRTAILLGSAVAAAALPLTLSFSPAEGSSANIVRLNTACAAEAADADCTLSIFKICVTPNGNERFYRKDGPAEPAEPVEVSAA